MVAGSKYRGEFGRIKKVISEVVEFDDVLLFIDGLHTSSGQAGPRTLDASNILKPSCAR